MKMKFSRKQLEKLADQTRLLAWAQGAVVTSASGLNYGVNAKSILLTIVNFIILQCLALFFDNRSEK